MALSFLGVGVASARLEEYKANAPAGLRDQRGRFCFAFGSRGTAPSP